MSDAGSVKDRPPLQTGSSAPHRLSSDESVFKAYKGVKTFDFSRESNLLVTGGLDRAIRLWNPYIPGWPTGLLQGHNAPISFLHISTEESRIYSVSTDNNVMVFKVWDLITGAPVFEFSGVQAKAAVTCMTLDISGKRLITGGRDGSVRKWDYSSGQCVSVLRHASDIADEVNSCIQVEIHSNRIWATNSPLPDSTQFQDHQDGANGIEDLGSQWLHQEPSPHREEIVSVSLWPPSLLATSSCAGELLVWNLISGNVFTRLGSADTAPLREGTVEVKFSSSVPEEQSPQKATVVALTLSGDDTLLFAGDRLGFVYIWNIQDYAQNAPETTLPPCRFGENEHWDVNEKESWSRELTEELRTASGDLPVQEPTSSRPESPTTSNPAERDSGNQLNTCQESTSSTNELAIEEELELYQYNPRVQRVHLKQVEIPQVCGRLMTFQSLHCHELADVHNVIHKPSPAAELNDPYDFSF
ncbi:UNVERIFIED_CONTAM: hypothetical protein FKN15_054411 [Acipenser sinensis]